MRFRARIVLALAAVGVLPIVLLALGARRELATRLETEHNDRFTATAASVWSEFARMDSRTLGALRSLRAALTSDDAFRAAVLRGGATERQYVIDYAERAMGLAGLDFLQIQDESGRVLSSGHFRNTFGQMEGVSVAGGDGGSPTLVRARTADGEFLAFVRASAVSYGLHRLEIVGGTRFDAGALSALARAGGAVVRLELPGDGSQAIGAPIPVGAVVADTLTFPAFIPEGGATGGTGPPVARVVVAQSRASLRDAIRALDRELLVALVVVALGVSVLASWLSAQLAAPIAELASAAGRIDLGGDSVAVTAARNDELGALARRVNGISARLRSSAVKLRDAERRATVGEMARQVNHDIKNGLVPIRNVLRHLGEVAERSPAELAHTFHERKGTLDSSVEYLDTLARNYARLTPRAQVGAVDVNALLREVARAAATDRVPVTTELGREVGVVHSDAVLLRRIFENVVRNGVESCDGAGAVVISTSRAGDAGVCVTIRDSGRGMSAGELARAFDDFHTTKAEGTGLGLSVVRRLVGDLRGSVELTSEPARGTTCTIFLPSMMSPGAPTPTDGSRSPTPPSNRS